MWVPVEEELCRDFPKIYHKTGGSIDWQRFVRILLALFVFLIVNKVGWVVGLNIDVPQPCVQGFVFAEIA